MNPNNFKARFTAGHSQPAEMVEWEELPSLADSLSRRLVVHGSPGQPHPDFQNSSAFHSAWDNTVPAALQTAFEGAPFRETIAGLAMREVHEPEVFRHFFG